MCAAAALAGLACWLPGRALASAELEGAQGAPAAPLRAVAEDGRRVLLLPNGTWRPADPQGSGPLVSGATSARDPQATSPFRTVVRRFTVKYDIAQWVLQPAKEGDPTRRHFRHRSLPLTAVIAADEYPVPTRSLRQVVEQNARASGVVVTPLIDEEREHSGHKVGYLRLLASVQGMDLIYVNQYYGDSDGNVQVICFTAQTLYAKGHAECHRFIDGLSIDPSS
jgi:hypothetical protein